MLLFAHALLHVVTAVLAMIWEVGWSLVLGFVLSGLIQVVVSRELLARHLGGEGIAAIARATAYGAASSSCSYASTAITKSLLAAGAGFIPSLAFLFASTNLVIELGIVLWRLMGWQFALAEWLGGVVLVAVMTVLVKATYPRRLVAQAREQAGRVSIGHDHAAETSPGETLLARLRAPQTRVYVAQSVAMDWAMLKGDLAVGFVVAGILATLVPDAAWGHIFFSQLPPGPRALADAAVGPLAAIITFVCSIGNVPLAAAVWAGGAGFGGVIAFLYADLLVLPLLDVYRKAFGLKTAVYLGVVFYLTMVVAAYAVGQLFSALHLVPAVRAIPDAAAAFRFDATLFLNVLALGVVAALIVINRNNPMHHCCHAAEPDDTEAACH